MNYNIRITFGDKKGINSTNSYWIGLPPVQSKQGRLVDLQSERYLDIKILFRAKHTQLQLNLWKLEREWKGGWRHSTLDHSAGCCIFSVLL